ncbi:Uncharacterized sodium-dependent transporter yocS [Papilio machaon]|uniref:Uncharacterized sodium-dependent transporter yocS n=1 Tax=Papilio machaon TaxID=76193 RepID=A0A0N1ICV4_PAPMA|nr:Uncharacterized sodium-dependent transporter yocS [Papilio machaon]
MDWPTVKDVIRRPIGPLIGLCGQFLFMPLMCFGLGFLIFPTLPEMHLGMFCTGVAPGGGASNIWTFVLGGNLNLSLAMTTISTLSAFECTHISIRDKYECIILYFITSVESLSLQSSDKCVPELPSRGTAEDEG